MCPLGRKTISWIDPCKGLGIYLVVLGHDNIHPTLQHFIYLFHMPLFFFLSGYLHTTRMDIGGFFRKKAIHLLAPYLSFLVLLYPLTAGRVFFHHGAGPAFASALLAGLWGGARLQGPYGVFWFLPCLFMTQQAMNLLLARFHSMRVTCIVLAATILSYVNGGLAPQLSLPLDANVVLAAMPFFYAGFLARGIPERLHRVLLGAAAVGAALGFYMEHLLLPISYNMRLGVYGIPGVSFLLALCCIACLIALARVLPAQRLLATLGAASMGIMFIHKQLPVFPALGRLSMVHGYLASIVFTAISLAITELLRQTVLTRGLLLGSEADFRSLGFAGSGIVRRHATSGV